MNKWLNKAFVFLLTCSFLGVLFFGSYLTNQGMVMVHEGCPFAANEQGMCPMMSFEHSDYVSSIVLKLIPLVVFASPVVIAVLFIRIVLLAQGRRVKVVSLEQMLFSQGILNPKAP